MDLAGGASAAATLILHDGELTEVRALLDDLTVPTVERRGDPAPKHPERSFGLAIGTPKRMLDLPPREPGQSMIRIAVADSESRTLRGMLRRAEVDYLVCRPVHPAALRHLILHSLYRGQERRRHRRVSVGAPVRYRTGMRQRAGLLIDLSPSGCQLLAAEGLRGGQSITVYVPAEAGGKALSVKGTVVRTAVGAGQGELCHSIHVEFEELSAKISQRLEAVIEARASGPTVLPEKYEIEQEDADPTAEDPEAPAHAEDAPLTAAAFELGKPEPESEPMMLVDVVDERRSDPRRILSRRLIALGEESTHILVGRDISTGGMRTEPNPNLKVGDELGLAIPLPGQETPLVVEARVVRDEGEAGLALCFQNLSEQAERLLREKLQFLAVCQSLLDGRDDDAAQVIVSEIVEHREG